MFPLCRTCAETEQRETCTHTDEERAILGTWCVVELNAAIAKGYAVAKSYEIWHFNEKSETLFRVHKITPPPETRGFRVSQLVHRRGKRNKYVSDFYQKEGVHSHQHEIRSNPAKRQIAKLFLNSLWGKFGQRSNLPNTSIVRDPDELLQYLFSPNYEVSSCEFIDDETACVSWKHAEERYSVSGNTNVFIACFTTVYARLELYSLLDGLQERCLYHDTDSVIFVKREGDWNPPLGGYLGDLTSEILPDQHITQFVSAGPKTYGYKLSGGKACMKVKGITLNVANCEKINFDSLKDLVLDYCKGLQENTSKKIEGLPDAFDDDSLFPTNKVNMIIIDNLMNSACESDEIEKAFTKHVPKGWDVFMNAMAELNVPTSVMGNASNRYLLERLKASTADTGVDRETVTPFLPSKKRKIS
nr:DNA polymerase-like [Chrysemys picta bellii]